jgi:putative transposase
MPQSLARLYVHLVFSTKHRLPYIADDVRARLHGYMGKVLDNLACPALQINSVCDHVHVLFDLSRTVSTSQVAEEVKKSSSKWMKDRTGGSCDFCWQSGYGAFSTSESQVQKVRTYIARQREHHAAATFQDEFRSMLGRHHLQFDERYIWD